MIEPTQPLATDYSGVREYVGARYVPLFADPAEWDNTQAYEPLTIVLYQGNSYTSKQYVPIGIDISNTNFWALTGNYNGQIENYRIEVQQVLQNMTFIRENETFSQALERAIETGTCLWVGEIETSNTLNIPLNAQVYINKIIYTGSNAIVNFTNGSYGDIKINYAYTNTPGAKGVIFDGVTEPSGNAKVEITYLRSEGDVFNYNASSTLYNTHFAGSLWWSNNGNGLNIAPNGGGWGQNNFDVTRVVSNTTTEWAIIFNSENGNMTGTDLGYISIEGSTNGILMQSSTSTNGSVFEPVYGTIRVIEAKGNNGKLLKIAGQISLFTGVSELHFDVFNPSNVDLTELIGTSEYLSQKTLAIINGAISENGSPLIPSTTMKIVGNHCCMERSINRITSSQNNQLSLSKIFNLSSDQTIDLTNHALLNDFILILPEGVTVTFNLNGRIISYNTPGTYYCIPTIDNNNTMGLNRYALG